jgi:hypothetical protein
VRARGRIKTSQKKIRRNNLIMVSTRKSPQKTRPTGVPTLSGQARVRAERAERIIILVIISTFLTRFMLISTFYVRFMLISAFYADQANYKNSALNAYHQANAVLCLSARLMIISWTIWRV